MGCDDPDQVEIKVIMDVLDTVEARLCERERCGWRLTVPRSHIYAVVLHAVIASARHTCHLPATLDRADVLDTILDGTEPANPDTARGPIEDAITPHMVPGN
ncbi:hypothetical protein CJ469_04866 [Nocardia farcinica]|uniref:hypothetical protein n=1 Tax=Nocardia farcinica TaxID=37329 RepID=UPI000BF66ADA|nr:hypothetical protein [Nocardia farcinica]PFW99832.1 hypothetical protein CJ469_04866 [Nocardia farcinica]PFX06291.1 hypothetical protein CJ468_04681 [Nocardia farcinica]